MKKIEINGEIVSNNVGKLYAEWFGMNFTYPEAVKQSLAEADGDDITVEINSQGGYVMQGYEIYNALKEYPGKVIVNVVFAASAATIIACAADETYISEAGMYMIHNCFGSAEGDYKEMANQSDALKQINEGIINVYEAKTGKNRDELQQLMDDSTYMSPQRAIELGFVDGLIPRQEKDGERKENKAADQNDVILKAIASAGDMSNIISDEEAVKVMAALEMQKTLGDTKNDKAVIEAAEDNKLDQAAGLESIQNNQTDNKGGISMTLEEVLNEHPEIQSEIDEKITTARNEGRDSGIAEERERIKSLDDIKNAVPDDMLDSAKYGENPIDGKELAYQAMMQGKQMAADYIKNAISDSNDSGVKDVGTGKIETGEPVNDEDAKANAAADYINKMKGAKTNE